MDAQKILQEFFCSPENKSNTYFGHCVRVSNYVAAAYNELLNIPELRDKFVKYTQDTVVLAGLLHDIGKIEVPISVLLKPGSLSASEWTAMRKHTLASAEILSNAVVRETILRLWPKAQIGEIIEVALSHHERPDGGGYPFGISKPITPLTRLCSICDTFDSITSDRPYRKAATAAQALEVIENSVGSQFNEKTAKALLENTDWTHPAGVAEIYVVKGEIDLGRCYQKAAVLGKS